MAKNRICELLGIRYPIIQAPMNWVSGAEICRGQVAGLITGVQGAVEVINDVAGTLGSRFEELKRKLDAFF